MNWKEKNYPATMTMRHWIKYAAVIVALIMVVWTVVSVRMSSNGQNMGEKKKEDKKITQMATKHDVSEIAPSPQQPSTIRSAGTSQGKNSTVISLNTTSGASSQSNTSEDELKAMQAPITQNQITSDTSSTQNVSDAETQEKTVTRASGSPDQNLQAEKKDFLKEANQSLASDYLGATLQDPLSKFEIQAGTIIPGVLMTGVDSDLPGQIIGQVRENVYDSISGKYILIPQGAKLIGVYDSSVAYGQTRVLVAWNRIIFPNGKSFDLKGMPGTDLTGYAGLNDQVDNHYMKIFGSVILLSVLSAGAQLSQPQNQNTSLLSVSNPTVGQTIAQSLGTNIANTGTMLTQKNINIQPTLKIRQGYEFNITATKDMVFPAAYSD